MEDMYMVRVTTKDGKVSYKNRSQQYYGASLYTLNGAKAAKRYYDKPWHTSTAVVVKVQITEIEEIV